MARGRALGQRDAEIVESHLWLVRTIVARHWGKAVQDSDFDDLVQAGTLGLIDAAQRFEPERGLKFSTYAGRRIFGAAADSLRKVNGRHAHRQGVVALESDMPVETQEDGREIHALDTFSRPAGEDVTARLGRIRVAVIRRLLLVYNLRVVRLAIAHYFDRRTLASLGAEFGVCESMVCKLLRPVRDAAIDAIEQEVRNNASA